RCLKLRRPMGTTARVAKGSGFPVGCVPPMNSIGRTPRKARQNGFCPVFPPFLPVYGRPPPEKSTLLQDVSVSPGKTTEYKRRKRWKRSDVQEARNRRRRRQSERRADEDHLYGYRP